MKSIKGFAPSRQPCSSDGEPGTGSLPCLYSNNSNKAVEKEGELNDKKEGETVQCLLSPANRKTAEALRLNVAKFIDVTGIENVGFLTLTFPDNVCDPKEAGRRFNSLSTSFFKRHPHFGEWICVKERQARGAWHYHLVIDCGGDIRTGFDRSEVKKRRYSAVTPLLRQLWADLRAALPRYNFGRHQLEPVLSSSEAMSKYLGKYISKHIGNRLPEDKGVRLVSYSSKWVRSSCNFQWNTENSAKWRRSVRFFALCHGFEDMDAISFYCGSNWGYRALGYILGSDWEALSVKEDLNFLQCRRWLQMYLGVESYDPQEICSFMLKVGVDEISALFPKPADFGADVSESEYVQSAFQHDPSF
jgi:hypothetical protein